MQDGFERDESRKITAVVADGVRYPVSRMKLMDSYPKFEEAYAATLAPPVEAMVAEFEQLSGSPKLQELLADRLYRDIREQAKSKGVKPPHADVVRWINTYDGVMFSWWLQLNSADSPMSISKVEQIISAAGAADAEFRALPIGKRAEAALNAANPEVQKLADEAAAASTLGEKLDALAANGVTPAEVAGMQKAAT